MNPNAVITPVAPANLVVGPTGFGLGSSGVARPNAGGVRAAVKGWTAASAGRFRRRLQSVLPEALTGFGLAITLTLRDTPSLPEWQKLRARLFDRWRKHGVLRYNWVVEMQSRGVPHLHCAVYVPVDTPTVRAQLICDWLDLASSYGALPIAQHVDTIVEGVGWAQYCAKHASRSCGHYQRSGKMPASWQGRTGRLWGFSRGWVTAESAFHLDTRTAIQFRRLLYSWARADALKSKCSSRLDRQRKLRAIERITHRPFEQWHLYAIRLWAPARTAFRLLQAALEVSHGSCWQIIKSPVKPSTNAIAVDPHSTTRARIAARLIPGSDAAVYWRVPLLIGGRISPRKLQPLARCADSAQRDRFSVPPYAASAPPGAEAAAKISRPPLD